MAWIIKTEKKLFANIIKTRYYKACHLKCILVFCPLNIFYDMPFFPIAFIVFFFFHQNSCFPFSWIATRISCFPQNHYNAILGCVGGWLVFFSRNCSRHVNHKLLLIAPAFPLNKIKLPSIGSQKITKKV